jgi:hypothetical protein
VESPLRTYSKSPATIDTASQATLQRFGLMILTIIGCAAWSGELLHTFVALTGVAAIVTASLAAVVQEPFMQPNLNRWDETAAYVGLHVLTRLASGTAP